MSEAAKAQKQGCETFRNPNKGRATDKVAAAVGLGSGRTYDKAAKVWEAAKEGNEVALELVGKLDKGEVSIYKAYSEAAKAQRQGMETFPHPEKGAARDKVASTIGIGSGRTYDKAVPWSAQAPRSSSPGVRQ
ncbi:MAG: hypothetical protein ACOYCE_07830 [Limnochordia bacterium]